jgi:hypothetical protein
MNIGFSWLWLFSFRRQSKFSHFLKQKLARVELAFCWQFFKHFFDLEGGGGYLLHKCKCGKVFYSARILSDSFLLNHGLLYRNRRSILSRKLVQSWFFFAQQNIINFTFCKIKFHSSFTKIHCTCLLMIGIHCKCFQQQTLLFGLTNEIGTRFEIPSKALKVKRG